MLLCWLDQIRSGRAQCLGHAGVGNLDCETQKISPLHLDQDAWNEGRREEGLWMAKHIVEQGECLSSIALQYGFMPDTIWNDPANAQLKFLRKDPNILYPGDEIEIPEREPWEGPRPTDARHKFRLKGRPE